MPRLKLALRLIGYNFKSILIFQIVYALFGTLLYLPTLAALFSLSLRAQEITFVSSEELVWFVTRPVTLLLLLAMLLIFGIYVLAGIGGLISAFHASYHRRKISVPEIINAGIETGFRGLHWRNLAIIPFVVATLPLTHVSMATSFLAGMPRSDMLETVIRGTPWLLRVAFILFFILCSVMLRRMFSLHSFTLNSITFKEARRRSFTATEGLSGANFLVYLFWTAWVALAEFLVLVLCTGAVLLGVWLFCAPEHARGTALGIVSGMTGGLLLLFSTAATPLSFAIVSALYYESREKAGEEAEPIGLTFAEPRLRKLRIAVGVAAASILLASLLPALESDYIPRVLLHLRDNPQVTAHRGDSGRAPENTLPAFQLAIESGAQFVELDVRLTKDGVLAVIHDATLRRVGGAGDAVADLTYAELAQYDVGSWFSEEFAGERVPALEDVMALCRGKIRLNIDLKKGGDMQALASAAAHAVTEAGIAGDCVISSADYMALRTVKEYDPGIRTAYIMNVVFGAVDVLDYADVISINEAFVTRDFVNRTHAAGKEVYVWTVNGRDAIHRMLDLGVDNIITDRPGRVREIEYTDNVTEFLAEIIKRLFPPDAAAELP